MRHVKNIILHLLHFLTRFARKKNTQIDFEIPFRRTETITFLSLWDENHNLESWSNNFLDIYPSLIIMIYLFRFTSCWIFCHLATKDPTFFFFMANPEEIFVWKKIH